MSDEACACLRVKQRTKTDARGLTSEWWECEYGCGSRFIKQAVADFERARLERRVEELTRAGEEMADMFRDVMNAPGGAYDEFGREAIARWNGVVFDRALSPAPVPNAETVAAIREAEAMTPAPEAPARERILKEWREAALERIRARPKFPGGVMALTPEFREPAQAAPVTPGAVCECRHPVIDPRHPIRARDSAEGGDVNIFKRLLRAILPPPNPCRCVRVQGHLRLCEHCRAIAFGRIRRADFLAPKTSNKESEG